jgi:hypothetical protein
MKQELRLPPRQQINTCDARNTLWRQKARGEGARWHERREHAPWQVCAAAAAAFRGRAALRTAAVTTAPSAKSDFSRHILRDAR